MLSRSVKTSCALSRIALHSRLTWAAIRLESSAAASSPTDDFPTTRPDLSPLLHHNSARRRLIDAALRVDHAGETAAVRIYEGQQAVLGNTAEGPTLSEMAAHERLHLERFQQIVRACSTQLSRKSGH